MPDLIDRKIRIARKSHTCSYCGDIIEKGEQYDWAKLVYEGTLYEWKAHLDCQMVATELCEFIDPDEGINEDDFQEGVDEFCRVFCCPDCELNEEKTGEDCGEPFCLHKVIEKLKTHDFVKERAKDGPYRDRLVWVLKPKEEP